MTLLATEVKLKLVIQLAKWIASTTPTPISVNLSCRFIILILWNPPFDIKKGRSIRDESTILQVAIVIGGASVNLIRIEAVDTATRLIIIARLGEIIGFSSKLI